jgi:hypothetical protein
MRILPKISLAVSLAATLLAPAAARAGGPADQAAAVALFQEARKLVDGGDFERACPKFAEAQKLLPTPGTALSLGDCYEKGGKLASAWGAFKQAEFFARGTGANDHQAEAQHRAEALAPKLAHLAIVVPPTAKVTGFEVRRDGDLVGEAQWGSPVPADTGWHTIAATAPGRRPWSTRVRVESDGSSASVDVPVLDAEVVPPAPEFWTGRRTAGVVVGATGLVGVVIGAIAGGMSLSKASATNGHCQPAGNATACDATGLSLWKEGTKLANVSNVALAAGGAALVSGVVLFATASAGDKGKAVGMLRISASAMLGARNGISIEGAW